MVLLNFECKREGNLVRLKTNGCGIINDTAYVKETILSELKPFKGNPFKILFDLRGFKQALDPRGQAALEEIDNYLYESSMVKIGTVVDSLIAKIQHSRIAAKDTNRAKEMLENDRARIFTNINECLAWLNEGDTVQPDVTGTA
jgi:hypothetical protein